MTAALILALSASLASSAPVDLAARTNAPASRAAPVNEQARVKASYLAAAGLVVLTLLGLGTGLALLRSFKR